MSQLKQLIANRQENLTYDIRVLSTGTVVKMRPYTVREEKEYMIAESSKDVKVFMDTIRNIISKCSFGVIKSDELEDYDIQFIMLQLKAKSKDDKISLRITCPNTNCNKEFNLNASLEKVYYASKEQHVYEIQIDDMTFYMQDPTIETYSKMIEASEKDISLSEKLDVFIEVISDCVTRVATVTDVIDFQTEDKETKIDFLYSLNALEIDKLKNFFDTMPNFHYDIDCKCPSCKQHITKTITGLDGFFFL